MSNSLPVELRLLLAEFRSQVLLHDLRGALGTAMGWAELSGLEGQPLPEGVAKAHAKMQGLLDAVGPLWPADELQLVDLHSFVLEHAGIDVVGTTTQVLVRRDALSACLRWARPEGASFDEEFLPTTDDSGGIRLVRLRLTGLCPSGAQLAGFPDLARIDEILQKGTSSVAAMLLRVAVRGSSGSLRVQSTGELVCKLRGDR